MSADLELVLGHISEQLETLTHSNRGSRFLGQAADRKAVDHVADGGSFEQRTELPEGWRTVAQRKANGLAGAMKKALALSTDATGGFLVSPDVSREVLMGLRARSAVLKLGPTVVPLAKSLDVVSLSSGATAAYLGENAPIPPSEETFAQAALLTPKELAALVPVSDRLLREADENPSVEEIIRRDLAEVLALRADLAFLRGTGSASEPLGIRNASGLTAGPLLGANGATPSFDDLKDVVAALRQQNAPFARPGWIFNPRLLNTLDKMKASDGRYLADAGLLTFDSTGAGGTLLGYPFATTTQIPLNVVTGSNNDTTEIYFSSDWNEAWLGVEDELRIEVSNEASYTSDGGSTWHSAWQQRQHLFRATWTHDLGLRRPQLFTCVVGVRP